MFTMPNVTVTTSIYIPFLDLKYMLVEVQGLTE